MKNLKESLYLIDPRHLVNFTAVSGLTIPDRQLLRKTGLTYFLFLFFFSGLEFTLTFLTHSRFNYDRYGHGITMKHFPLLMDLVCSVQQGKMFFFIGLTMILVQGGYVRRLKSGKEKGTALMVRYVLRAHTKIAWAVRQRSTISSSQWEIILYSCLIYYRNA